MTESHPLDITGTRATALVLPLSPDAITALAEAGVNVPQPAQVRLLLTESTMRERARFETDQQPGGPAQTDPVNWLADRLMHRAEPGTERAVVLEMLADCTPTDFAMLTHAYVMGVLPDPKATQQAVQMTLTGISNGLLATLASAGPSPS